MLCLIQAYRKTASALRPKDQEAPQGLSNRPATRKGWARFIEKEIIPALGLRPEDITAATWPN